MNIQIIRSKPSDALVLTKIAKAAKKYWGYSDEQIKKWESELTIQPAHIKEDIIYHILANDKIVGFYSLYKEDDRVSQIDHFWILPEYIKQSLGTKLFAHLKKTAKNNDTQTIRVVSDPNAEGFYIKMGAKRIGKEKSSIRGRILPILEISLM